MNNDRILKESEKIIEEILIILNSQLTDLKKKGYYQTELDRSQGLARKNGILLLLKSVDHRILFDGYETSFLETFIKLYVKLFKNFNETFAQFAIRTLEEMGVRRGQILFNTELDSKERNKYKLLLWLADYASISIINPKNKDTYNKLLKEYEDLLKPKEYFFYSTLLQNLEKGDPIVKHDLIRTARQRINSLQGNLYPKTKMLPFFKKINLIAMSSSFSHILHGNVLLLNDVLDQKRPQAQQMRVFWGLLIAGVNVINGVKKYLENANYDSQISKINNDFIKLDLEVKKNWSSL